MVPEVRAVEPSVRETSAEGLTIRVRPARIARGLSVGVATLAGVGLIANRLIYAVAPDLEHPLARAAYRFDLGLEPSLPNWFSSLLLLAAAVLLWVNGRTELGAGRRGWRLLAVVFAALAVDEAIMIHEMANDTLHEALGTTGPLFFAWILPGLAFAAAVALASVGLLRRVDPRTRALFLLAGVMFLGGSVGMEMIAGVLVEAHGAESIHHAFEQVVEESLEMSGTVVFLYALLDRLGRWVGEVRFSFEGSRA